MSRARTPRLRLIVCTLVASLGGNAPARAQAPPPAAPARPAPPTLSIASVSCGQTADGQPAPCELGRLLQVQLASASPWLESQRSLDSLLLVINGVPFEHITAQSLDDSGNKLRFKLDPRLDAPQWKTLYAGQPARATFYVSLAVREPGNLAATTPVLTLVSNAVTTPFRVRPDYRWAIYVGLLILVLCVVVLARRSNLLRDRGDTGTGQLRPYSLARAQLAAWTVTIVGSYLFIWAVLGNTDPLNDTALILMGLSALTGLGATLVDNLGSATSAAPAPAASTGLAVSAGFLIDILSDDDGVSIYRFQMAVWTLVLVVVFVYTVWNTLAMPDFSAMLLGLMGISNGAYVGLKKPST
jgi:hypothetical protein